MFRQHGLLRSVFVLEGQHGIDHLCHFSGDSQEHPVSSYCRATKLRDFFHLAKLKPVPVTQQLRLLAQAWHPPLSTLSL